MIADLRQWSKRPVPSAEVLDGKLIRLQRLDLAKHFEDLWTAVNDYAVHNASHWRYHPYGPFTDRQSLDECLKEVVRDEYAVPYAVVNKSNGKAQGISAVLPCDHRSPPSTITAEAVYLLLKQAFELGYRRVEWICAAVDEECIRSTIALGFTYEGIRRQHRVLKGRNSDDCFFGIMDHQWARLSRAYERWLPDGNLEDGTPRKELSAFIEEECGLCPLPVLPPLNTHPVPNWEPAKRFDIDTLQGQLVRLEALDMDRHFKDVYEMLSGPDADPKQFDYTIYGPFKGPDDCRKYLESQVVPTDRMRLYAIINPATRKPEGLIGVGDVDRSHGRIQVRHIVYGNAMRRSAKGTEAVYLVVKECFALGYRSVYWSCNNLNENSRKAAERLGFVYEAVHPQSFTYKGVNSDRRMYSILDGEWPPLQKAFEEWLAAANQTTNGQKASLLE
ncbi:hypothetical protein AAVH_21818 [Aphelenchoides avenae]|nr:hypothetical protein AAVH_21818 [Aphelenchus avenae]